MSLTATGTNDTGREIDPAGLHHAICFAMYDLGQQETDWGPKHKVVFLFEYVELTYDHDGETHRKIKSAMFTSSLHPKSNMRPFFESWRGKAFTETETIGFDLKNVLGANCYLNIIHETKNGKTYANIGAIIPLKQGEKKLEPEHALTVFDMDDGGEIPENAPDWIKDKINNSLEKKGSNGSQDTGMGHAGENVPVNDDIPF